ncbi:MAG TPA: 3-deoxy-7-phosphoheptulonate synthase [Hungateiclostridium thermocellum]|jgi:3-deoxy-7-phosphoheptulonate synthase|uniref:Phospho-2-dehydro-3-deoxyheptonate aldolase n=2 Tax=Acetivibrio thermocellus TaxID=1515 RepID=A3DDT5_ACET2|nr:3-deoxy-7-phosphoheptulonate synthase [Acetivibrio thermocellus]CDG35572.1 Phospho-2-dehydro-3-deoxyheptonate aldolase [Acetivibrio thermocellus BC1]ABN52114.1 phospho-2-dehydro-3-deoxyheptonate aldolase [Acetivibrio thermocellus ATCC 27405]ADU74403.1 phospho-2-dehydro-3-deoxyheptonate aldolase [Acetivibrio thermocellus DSM 1313]ALX08346.1 phospho-2-dehydro-3-deoxyheptonate aldolase [Acetivibrio thermocellus AD2]ANV76095.1 phospho-2-dehydro-3-deoxyheptonate aldolase [Acetivibrio thermocellu
MIIVMSPNATKEQIENVEKKLLELGFKTHPIVGDVKTVIGAIGDKRLLNTHSISTMPGVESIVPIMKPYKLASKELKQEPTIVEVGDVRIGGNEVVVMAGPCAIENEEIYVETAKKVKEAGAKILRGGAFKPRTSPYSFQGLEEEGLKIMAIAREVTGLKLVTEVVDTRDVELVASYTDIIQIGARNMQNFRLLKEVGMSNKPVLLKRGLAATIEEWLMAAEYIISEGNPNVILCERGIRTFETATRNTIDMSAIPVIKELSHLPIVLDPSHAAGTWKYVEPLAKGAIATGADGLIIEVHSQPDCALCDGQQSLIPSRFEQLMKDLEPIALAVGRKLL